MHIPSRLISACIALTGLIVIAIGVGIWHLGITGSATGMAAKLMCSGVFVANRNEQDVLTNDIRATSVLMSLPGIVVDNHGKTVRARIPGLNDRYAVWRKDRGCILLASDKLPEPTRRSRAITDRTQTNNAVAVASDSITRQPTESEQWPAGSAKFQSAQWPSSVDVPQLTATIDQAFATPKSSSFSPNVSDSAGANTRALLIAHRGRLLVERYSIGFDKQTPQLGLSMAKSVLSALVWKSFVERGIDFDTPVVDLMQRVPRAQWAADWRRDERASISLNNLIHMQDGLDHVKDQSIASKVVSMLFSEGDIGHFAASVPLKGSPGEQWRYSSAVSNLLSRVLRDQFSSDARYWAYPKQALFDPIGAQSALIETDDSGTFVASTYMWATPQDWLRIGQLLANDGRWGKQQVIPQGWFQWASKANNTKDGSPGPYGAHVWLTNAANTLDCPRGVSLPTNGIVMAGHWGQMLAVFPDQELVILRMGWTSNSAVFRPCVLFHDVLTSVSN